MLRKRVKPPIHAQPQEVRDFRNQARYWAGEAQQLRDQLRNDGVNAGPELEEWCRHLEDSGRTVTMGPFWRDPEMLERSLASIARGETIPLREAFDELLREADELIGLKRGEHPAKLLGGHGGSGARLW